MTRCPCLDSLSWVVLVSAIHTSSCATPKGNTAGPSTGGASASSGGGAGGGESNAAAGGRDTNGSGGETAEVEPTPKYYPIPGFEDCMHVEVKADCEDGWCKLPPSCFVMGAPEYEWRFAEGFDNQAPVSLTHTIEVQKAEFTRAEWKTIAGLDAAGPETCTELTCPVVMVSWWDAVSAADLLSQQRGLEPCYSPVSCTGTLGVDLECTGVADPERSVYECEGYRLPTRAEVEYAARAGTWSTWYSGDITTQVDLNCHPDAALEQIAWYCQNSDGKVHRGEQLKANDFGLYDIIGNIDEWVGESKVGSSPGGVDPRGAIGQDKRRLRFGATFESPSHHARTSSQLSSSWETKYLGRGFRLYRTLFEDSERSQAIVEKE